MKFDRDTPGVFPSRVYDAFNHEIHYVVEGDTETGWCCTLILDPEGHCYFQHDGSVVDHVWVHFAAPLRLERIGTLREEV